VSEVDQPVVVKLIVTNRSAHSTTLVLEPAGEIYPIQPGQSRVVLYAGDPTPRLAIDVSDDETKIWEEGVGTLELDE
jgi:hypothetical protein